MNKSKNDALEKRIIFLDYLRIFAFAAVLAGHKFYLPIGNWLANETGIMKCFAQIVWALTEAGGAGVIVFLMVSGYIITSVLQRETTPIFLIKRVFRIYPLYLTALLIETIFKINAGGKLDLSILLWQATLLGDINHTYYSLGGVEWTLRLEILFYIIMAVLNSLNFIKPTNQNNPIKLVFIFASIISFLNLAGPFTTAQAWSLGYISLYMTFLFIGSVFWLYENKKISLLAIIAFIIFAFVIYEVFFLKWHSNTYIKTKFEFIGFGIFFIFWLARDFVKRLKSIPACYFNI